MSPSPRASTDRLLGDVETYPDVIEHNTSTDIPESQKHIEKSLLRKLDLRTFFLVFVYIMNHVDRSNVAAARLKGLEEDLHMTGRQFNTLVSVMYIGYVPMQIPSNIFLDRLRRPSAYLSFCIFMWGIFSMSTGAATSFHDALLPRFLLGLSEAAYYPGVIFLLSRWYKRNELGLRMVYLVCGASASKVIGPLTASAILGTMDGKFGYAAWRWLFFIEGAFTCALTVVALYMIPDYPDTPASWLTVDEQILAQKRMVEDTCGIEDDPLKSPRRSGLMEALADWTVWWLAIAAISEKTMMSFENFFPTLAATLGYSPTISLFLCAPPWVLGVTTSFFIMRFVLPSTSHRFPKLFAGTQMPLESVFGIRSVQS
ncbi:major facilitator superfamily domain-containing protein [Scleroderma yunnanense]